MSYIQKMPPKNKANSTTDEGYIDELLEEADSYGLRYEVEMFAEEILKKDPALSRLDAYVMAYHDWIK